MMSGMSEDDSKSVVNSELSDIKLLREDGSEVPADIVLRDKDLDLAFIRPKTRPSTPMAALDLGQAGTAQILDQVISLNRLGEAAGRSYAASVERVSAIARKPRLFYLPSGESSVTMGAPVFTADGKVLGIFVMRSINRKSSFMDMLSSRSDALTPIILPGTDILKAARQAPEAKPDAQKNEPPPAK
jgi:S1-C subfamily serine protease